MSEYDLEGWNGDLARRPGLMSAQGGRRGRKDDRVLRGARANRRPRLSVGGPHEIPITLAVADYDHVRDLTTGVVPVEGVRLTCVHHPGEEIFCRFTRHREWEVSEPSLAKYSSLRAADERPYGVSTIFVGFKIWVQMTFAWSIGSFLRERVPAATHQATDWSMAWA